VPIYEFLCEACGDVTERIQKVDDPAPGRCRECGSPRMAKLVSRSAFQLKGGGWYKDLYASSGSSGQPAKKKAGD
jgi:putative FmdB family regulatory protein